MHTMVLLALTTDLQVLMERSPDQQTHASQVAGHDVVIVANERGANSSMEGIEKLSSALRKMILMHICIDLYSSTLLRDLP